VTVPRANSRLAASHDLILSEQSPQGIWPACKGAIHRPEKLVSGLRV
jgi:hypothetical protein